MNSNQRRLWSIIAASVCNQAAALQHLVVNLMLTSDSTSWDYAVHLRQLQHKEYWVCFIQNWSPHPISCRRVAHGVHLYTAHAYAFEQRQARTAPCVAKSCSCCTGINGIPATCLTTNQKGHHFLGRVGEGASRSLPLPWPSLWKGTVRELWKSVQRGKTWADEKGC